MYLTMKIYLFIKGALYCYEKEGCKFKIVKADETDLDVRAQMGNIFADGFTQWLGYFSKDKNVIAKAFSHMFVLEQFYVAVTDDEVAGVAACTDGESQSVKLNAKELRKHLGLFKGSMAGIFLKKEFEAPYVDFPRTRGRLNSSAQLQNSADRVLHRSLSDISSRIRLMKTMSLMRLRIRTYRQ